MRKERIMLKVSSLVQNNGQLGWLPKNPRQWTQTDIDRTAASIREDEDFLEDRPLLVVPKDAKTWVVFAGNLRLTAAKKIGLKEVPCIAYARETDEDDTTIKRRAMKDNGSFGAWDYDALANEWDDLPLQDWGVPAWEGEAEPAPEVKEDDFNEDADTIPVRCNAGDIWQLGNHRLMCGDSTDADTVKKLMDGTKADMVFTDPPYGIGVVGSDGNIGGDTQYAKAAKYKKVIGDDTEFDPALILELFSASRIFLWGANYYANKLSNSGKWIVWDKNRGEGTTFSDCELCWTNLDGVAIKKYKCTWDGMRREGESGRRVHPTQKPVKLCSDIICDNSIDGEKIVDLFGGSGSTLIAAEQTGRKCYMMELDPHYCDVIISRWETFTGKTAQLITPGDKVS